MVLLSILLYKTSLSLIALVLFLGILLFYYLGSVIGHSQWSDNIDNGSHGFGWLDGALLGLLSLLLAFTFGMSAIRYDARKALIVQEANEISTVIFRADMYPDSVRMDLRKSLREYIDSRIAYYDAVEDTSISQSLLTSERITKHIWSTVIDVAKKWPDAGRDNQMIPAINGMTNVVALREASRLSRVPDIIIYLLFSLTIFGGFIIGYRRLEKKNDLIMLVLYSLMTIMTIYTICDLDRPRRGIIQTSTTHEKIDELQNYFIRYDVK